MDRSLFWWRSSWSGLEKNDAVIMLFSSSVTGGGGGDDNDDVFGMVGVLLPSISLTCTDRSNKTSVTVSFFLLLSPLFQCRAIKPTIVL